MVFFSIKKLISLIVRRRAKRGNTVIPKQNSNARHTILVWIWKFRHAQWLLIGCEPWTADSAEVGGAPLYKVEAHSPNEHLARSLPVPAQHTNNARGESKLTTPLYHAKKHNDTIMFSQIT